MTRKVPTLETHVIAVAHSPRIYWASSLLCWPFGAPCGEPLDFCSLTGALFWTYSEKKASFTSWVWRVRLGLATWRCLSLLQLLVYWQTVFTDLQWCVFLQLFLHFFSSSCFLFVFVLFFSFFFFFRGVFFCLGGGGGGEGRGSL